VGHVLHEIRGGRFNISTGDSVIADVVFTCVGFRANSAAVGSSPALQACLTSSGQLCVNDQLQVEPPVTSASYGRVYGVGDVSVHAGSLELKLAHTAEMMAHTAAHNITASAKEEHGTSSAGVITTLGGMLMGVFTVLLTLLGVGPVPQASSAALQSYPGHITGFTGWPIPRVMCVSLGPSEAILIMNGFSLTSFLGRHAGAWAKWVIETSKMWAVRDLAAGHAVWVFGDAAAVAVSNFVLLPLASNQPPALVHRVASGSAAPSTSAAAAAVWGVWRAALSALAYVWAVLLPGSCDTHSATDAAGKQHVQRTATL
jgi:NADH dehydrogenase FAD-containing subunit